MAGAGSILGTDVVAKAAPDGYTLAVVATSHAINPSVYAKMPYDTSRDLAPVAHTVNLTNLSAGWRNSRSNTLLCHGPRQPTPSPPGQSIS